MKIVESLTKTTNQLAAKLIVDADLESEVLHRYALGLDRARFLTILSEILTPEEEHFIGRLVRRRLSGKPLSYVVGIREFHGLDFVVNPDVLVPRQETELLVDITLGFYSPKNSSHLLIADVGTGSGAIAISIAHYLPQAIIFATDISTQALTVANVNSQMHGVSNQVQFIHGDLLIPLTEPVDLILSNPPYIKTTQISSLAQEVRSEPVLALDGGKDGLSVTRRIFDQSAKYLKAKGRILVEISPEQRHNVLQIAKTTFPNASVHFESDLLGLPRVVVVEVS